MGSKIIPHTHNPNRNLIKGCWYRAIVFNGAVFNFWVQRKLKRNELRPVALEFIGENIYEIKDIDSVRKLEGELK